MVIICPQYVFTLVSSDALVSSYGAALTKICMRSLSVKENSRGTGRTGCIGKSPPFGAGGRLYLCLQDPQIQEQDRNLKKQQAPTRPSAIIHVNKSEQDETFEKEQHNL